MHRGALHIGALLLALAPGVAFAHDGPPEVYAVLSLDAAGPRAVSMAHGVALRRSAQAYQYVCPMAWGDQFPAPLAALADGTIVVGAARGLMLLGEDASIRAHPDPAAAGISSDVGRSSRGVFSLRSGLQGGSEVLAVDAQQVRVLWKDTKSWTTMGVLDDKLVLLRASGTMLEQVTIGAADGAELERQMAVVDLPMDFVFARVNAGAVYALLWFRRGTMALGSLRANVFTKLADDALAIAGPLSVGNVTLLALDGKLAQLVDGQMMPLADEHSVNCLAERDGLTYACDTDGIARVSGPVLGEPLFRFAWVGPPELERLPEGDERFLCNSQWQDYRFDVQSLMPDAGNAPVDPSLAGAAGAPLPPMAGAGGQAAAGGPAIAPEQPVQSEGSGCVALSGRRTPPRAAGAVGLAFMLVLVVVRCCGRRPARSSK